MPCRTKLPQSMSTLSLARNPSPPEVKAGKDGKLWTVGTLTYSTGGLIILFAWLLWGDFAWSMRDRSIPAIMQLLFKKYGASDMLTGLLIGSLPAVFIMTLCPIISYQSDRLRSRWGRRIPFLMAPVPFVVLAIVGLAFSPQIGSFVHDSFGIQAVGRNATILAFMAIFWTLFEFGCITAYSVFGALVKDVVPEAVLGRFFGMFRVIGLTAAIIFNFWLLGKAEVYYTWIFLAVAVLYGFGFTLMCFKVKEGQYAPPPPVSPSRTSSIGFLLSLKDYARECFGNRYFLLYFFACSLSALSLQPVNLFSLYYAKSVSMDIGDYGKCLALTYIISLVCAYPLGSLADRFHPLRMVMVVLGIYSAALLLGGFFIHDEWSFGIGLVAHGVISGTYATAAASLGQRLLPRVKFAQLASAGGIINCLFTIVLAPLLGWFLDTTHHDYRFTFFVGSAIALAGLFMNVRLHRQFLFHGGPKNYIPPE